MRISDWSSDVCSSDLPLVDADVAMKPHRMVEAGRHEAGRPEAHAVRQHRRGQKAHVRREGEEAAMDERVVAERPRDAAPLLNNRKSVVEGKEVSGSVDPGG